MKEYLRMSDVFKGELSLDCDCDDVIVDELSLTVLESFGGSDLAKYALHAINSHDELVAEVERLRGLMVRIISSAHELSRKMPTTEFGGGYKQCAMDTANAIESYLNKGA